MSRGELSRRLAQPLSSRVRDVWQTSSTHRPTYNPPTIRRALTHGARMKVPFAHASAALLVLLLPLLSSAQSGYRYGNVYSDSPCPSGGRVVDVAPPVSVQGAQTDSVYLCKSSSGGRFWSSAHCRQNGAFVERIESVPADLPWAQRVELTNQQTEAGRCRAAGVMAQRGASTPGVTARGQGPNCASYNEQIRHIDELARRPSSPQWQGHLAAQRKAVPDAQFRAGC